MTAETATERRADWKASVKRREDPRLLTGRGRYAEDCNAPDQVYVTFVRSPHAHAELIAIDPAPATPERVWRAIREAGAAR